MSAFVFILVRAIEYFVVLEGIEAMAERQKLDVDLQRRLEDREAQIAFLRLRSFQCSTETGTGSGFPIDIYTALGGPDTGSTLSSRSLFNGKRIE